MKMNENAYLSRVQRLDTQDLHAAGRRRERRADGECRGTAATWIDGDEKLRDV